MSKFYLPATCEGFLGSTDESMAEELRFAVEYACLAPSGRYHHPWKFRTGSDYIDLVASPKRRCLVVDPQQRELYISCGAALFYLRLALRCAGYADLVELFPDPKQQHWVARVYAFAPTQPTPEENKLFQAIPYRRANRRPLLLGAIPKQLPARMILAAAEEHVQVKVIGDDSGRPTCISLVGEGVRALSEVSDFRQEMKAWYRSNGEKASIGGKMDEILHGGPLVSATGCCRQLVQQEQMFAEEAPLLIALGAHGDTRQDWIAAGQALARVLLLAAGEGINATYLNYPLQVEHLRHLVRDAIGMTGEPQLLLAMGHTQPL